MGKLVRDRIPEIMRAEGVEPDVHILEEEDFVRSLFEKLFEEAQELKDAAPSERLEEAADVLEVLTAIVEATGHTLEEVRTHARVKRGLRGGFAERIWLD